MKAFFAAVKRSPKLAALTAALVGAVIVPAALMAWGPDRPTYTMASPADHVTFNSITDNPNHGDERNFVQIKDATAGGNYGEDVNLVPGHEYSVYVFYHNNASSTLNDSGVGIAHGAAMRVQMPATVSAGQEGRVTGIVSATNANPQQVWDEAYGHAAQDVALRYESGSAVINSLGAVNGQALPDSLITSGTPIGFDALNGELPGCTHYEGYVVFKFKAVAPNFSVEKTVSKAGANAFAKSINVNPSDEVEYSIQYKNTGTVEQDNVVFKDKLPAGVVYEPGTTKFVDSTTNGQWKNTADNNVVTGTGLNLGNYAPGSNAYVDFKAKIVDESKLPKCGANTLVNTATVETANGSQSDTASVVVNKVCQGVPPELPQTGTSDGILTITGMGALTAGLAYALRSARIRNLLRG